MAFDLTPVVGILLWKRMNNSTRKQTVRKSKVSVAFTNFK